jgi:hypothetical protein
MISIGVVADPRRSGMGERLAEQVNADYLSVDEGQRGCTWNHSQVWRAHASSFGGPADWNVVLEDDAIPVDGFREQLADALSFAPAPIVSLYLGRGYIEDRYIEPLLVRADLLGVNWIVSQGRILHAVALAVRGALLPSLVANLPRGNHPIDRSLSLWARRQGHAVAYSNPSLVEHDDGKSLVTRYRRAERRAWRIGVRDDWCAKMIAMV